MESKKIAKYDFWRLNAERFLRKIIRLSQTVPELKKRGVNKNTELSIAFIHSRKIKKLNRKFRKKSYATDVLSFEAPPLFRQIGVLGELIIGLQVMKAQAKKLSHSPLTEMRILCIHGFLHLLGYDHENDETEALEMKKIEKRLLELYSSRYLKNQSLVGLIERVE